MSSPRRPENDATSPSQYPFAIRYSLFAILLLAFLLRLYCLTCSSYWHDEGNTWALVQRSFAQIAADAGADIHPPGYYWLLKVWSFAFGHSPWALRAFSALTGTATVAVVYAITRAVVGRRSAVPLLAALLAALNPFQIYYSQEARMYSLLMLECAALVWIGLQMADRRSQFTIHNSQFIIHNSQFIIFFALLAAAGLWTHYIFSVVLAAVGLAFLWTRRKDFYAIRTTHYAILPFLAANLLALLLYLPWLPTAIDRILSWPAGGAAVSPLDGLRLTLQTLAVGPIRTGPELAWPWLLLVGLLPLTGLWRLRRSPAAPVLALWLLAPIGLMFGLGLYTESFLKFLLVASPVWCVLTANCVLRIVYSVPRFTPHASRLTRYASTAAAYAIRHSQFVIFFVAVLLAALLAALTLPGYYTDPAARDNYAGMAGTVAALADSDTDAVILNAPGQADVWRIYDPGLPVLALPHQRPPDRASTEAALADFATDRGQLFALFWATEQADPDGIVESWLNRHAFKGLESWQGNVRFVQYSLPHSLACEKFTPPVHFGDAIQLTRICLPPDRAVVAGASLPVALHWQTRRPIDRRYKATLQLLDARNHVMGQQDGEPGGGGLPTDGWQPGTPIVDNRGVYASPGAPPVRYRLVLALYDPETGQRLPVSNGDALPLGWVQISRPAQPIPTDIVPIRTRLNRPVGPLVLLGFDAYAKGFAHNPDRALSAGEQLHLTLYWQAPDPLPADWPDDLSYTLSLDGEEVSGSVAGSDFPTADWQAGDFVRGDADIPYRADGLLTLTVNGQTIRLGRVVDGRLR